MENLVTVATFTFPSELSIIRARLESENIECFVKDEITTQVHHFYSNAIGGIKLQVEIKNKEKAIEILKEQGFIFENDISTNNFWIKIKEKTDKVPFINKLRLELRLMLIIGFLTLSIVSPIVILNIPSTKEYLTDYNWCVSHITYNDKDYIPYSLGLQISGFGFCNEDLNFKNDGYVSFPGFETYPIKGKWKLNSKTLHINDIDTLQYLFEGDYKIDVNSRRLIITSDKTIIYCNNSRY